MGFWDKIRRIFTKKESKNLEERFEKDDFQYTGDEPVCGACQMPIHGSHRSRKMNGKRLHIFCFRKIKRIALRGGGIDEFSN